MKTRDFMVAFLESLKGANRRRFAEPNTPLSGVPGVVYLLERLNGLGFNVGSELRAYQTLFNEVERRPSPHAPDYASVAASDGFMSGAAGPPYTRALIATLSQDEKGASDATTKFVQAWNRPKRKTVGLSELFGGSAGYWMLARTLRERMPTTWTAPREALRHVAAEARAELLDVMKKPLARRDSSAFSGPGTSLYLGFAHGVAGELYAFYTDKAPVPSVVKTRLAQLEALALRADKLVAWPVIAGGEVPNGAWGTLCNGTPGMLMLWTAVAAKTGLAADLELASACAETTFTVRPPTNTICCGGGGHAIALARYAEFASDQRARRHARARVQHAMTSVGDDISLFKGQAGVAWCAAALATRTPLDFPFFS